MTSKKNTLLRSAELRWGLVIAAIGAFVFLRSLIILPHEQKKYDKHAQDYLQKHNARKEGLTKRFSKQQRFQVIKHLWMSGREPRLEIEMKAVTSEVGVTLVKSETRLIETFRDTEGMIQEELFYKDSEGHEYAMQANGKLARKGKAIAHAIAGEEAAGSDIKETPVEVALADVEPMQRFRYFEADSAVYDYHSNTLIASKVNFWTYVAPGHELVKDRENLWPESSGSAGTMTVCHLGSADSLQFSAENLNMELAPQW